MNEIIRQRFIMYLMRLLLLLQGNSLTTRVNHQRSQVQFLWENPSTIKTKGKRLTGVIKQLSSKHQTNQINFLSKNKTNFHLKIRTFLFY